MHPDGIPRAGHVGKTKLRRRDGIIAQPKFYCRSARAEGRAPRARTTAADLREVGLTSLDMVSLVLSVESEFGIKIPEREITPTNFRSIATIETLVARLRR